MAIRTEQTQKRKLLDVEEPSLGESNSKTRKEEHFGASVITQLTRALKKNKPCQLLLQSHVPYFPKGIPKKQFNGVYKIAYDKEIIYVSTDHCQIAASLLKHFSVQGQTALGEFLSSLDTEEFSKITLFWLYDAKYKHACGGKSYLECISQILGYTPRFNCSPLGPSPSTSTSNEQHQPSSFGQLNRNSSTNLVRKLESEGDRRASGLIMPLNIEPCHVLQQSHLPYRSLLYKKKREKEAQGAFKVAYEWKTIYVSSDACDIEAELVKQFSNKGQPDLVEFLSQLTEADFDRISVYWVSNNRHSHNCGGKSYVDCVSNLEGHPPRFNQQSALSVVNVSYQTAGNSAEQQLQQSFKDSRKGNKLEGVVKRLKKESHCSAVFKGTCSSAKEEHSSQLLPNESSNPGSTLRVEPTETVGIHAETVMSSEDSTLRSLKAMDNYSRGKAEKPQTQDGQQLLSKDRTPPSSDVMDDCRCNYPKATPGMHPIPECQLVQSEDIAPRRIEAIGDSRCNYSEKPHIPQDQLTSTEIITPRSSEFLELKERERSVANKASMDRENTRRRSISKKKAMDNFSKGKVEKPQTPDGQQLLSKDRTPPSSDVMDGCRYNYLNPIPAPSVDIAPRRIEAIGDSRCNYSEKSHIPQDQLTSSEIITPRSSEFFELKERELGVANKASMDRENTRRRSISKKNQSSTQMQKPMVEFVTRTSYPMQNSNSTKPPTRETNVTQVSMPTRSMATSGQSPDIVSNPIHISFPAVSKEGRDERMTKTGSCCEDAKDDAPKQKHNKVETNPTSSANHIKFHNKFYKLKPGFKIPKLSKLHSIPVAAVKNDPEDQARTSSAVVMLRMSEVSEARVDSTIKSDLAPTTAVSPAACPEMKKSAQLIMRPCDDDKQTLKQHHVTDMRNKRSDTAATKSHQQPSHLSVKDLNKQTTVRCQAQENMNTQETHLLKTGFVNQTKVVDKGLKNVKIQEVYAFEDDIMGLPVPQKELTHAIEQPSQRTVQHPMTNNVTEKGKVNGSTSICNTTKQQNTHNELRKYTKQGNEHTIIKETKHKNSFGISDADVQTGNLTDAEQSLTSNDWVTRRLKRAITEYATDEIEREMKQQRLEQQYLPESDNQISRQKSSNHHTKCQVIRQSSYPKTAKPLVIDCQSFKRKQQMATSKNQPVTPKTTFQDVQRCAALDTKANESLNLKYLTDEKKQLERSSGITYENTNTSSAQERRQSWPRSMTTLANRQTSKVETAKKVPTHQSHAGKTLNKTSHAILTTLLASPPQPNIQSVRITDKINNGKPDVYQQSGPSVMLSGCSRHVWYADESKKKQSHGMLTGKVQTPHKRDSLFQSQSHSKFVSNKGSVSQAQGKEHKLAERPNTANADPMMQISNCHQQAQALNVSNTSRNIGESLKMCQTELACNVGEKHSVLPMLSTNMGKQKLECYARSREVISKEHKSSGGFDKKTSHGRPPMTVEVDHTDKSEYRAKATYHQHQSEKAIAGSISPRVPSSINASTSRCPENKLTFIPMQSSERSVNQVPSTSRKVTLLNTTHDNTGKQSLNKSKPTSSSFQHVESQKKPSQPGLEHLFERRHNEFSVPSREINNRKMAEVHAGHKRKQDNSCSVQNEKTIRKVDTNIKESASLVSKSNATFGMKMPLGTALKKDEVERMSTNSIKQNTAGSTRKADQIHVDQAQCGILTDSNHLHQFKDGIAGSQFDIPDSYVREISQKLSTSSDVPPGCLVGRGTLMQKSLVERATSQGLTTYKKVEVSCSFTEQEFQMASKTKTQNKTQADASCKLTHLSRVQSEETQIRNTNNGHNRTPTTSFAMTDLCDKKLSFDIASKKGDAQISQTQMPRNHQNICKSLSQRSANHHSKQTKEILRQYLPIQATNTNPENTQITHRPNHSQERTKNPNSKHCHNVNHHVESRGHIAFKTNQRDSQTIPADSSHQHQSREHTNDSQIKSFTEKEQESQVLSKRRNQNKTQADASSKLTHLSRAQSEETLKKTSSNGIKTSTTQTTSFARTSVCDKKLSSAAANAQITQTQKATNQQNSYKTLSQRSTNAHAESQGNITFKTNQRDDQTIPVDSSHQHQSRENINHSQTKLDCNIGLVSETQSQRRSISSTCTGHKLASKTTAGQPVNNALTSSQNVVEKTLRNANEQPMNTPKRTRSQSKREECTQQFVSATACRLDYSKGQSTGSANCNSESEKQFPQTKQLQCHTKTNSSSRQSRQTTNVPDTRTTTSKSSVRKKTSSGKVGNATPTSPVNKLTSNLDQSRHQSIAEAVSASRQAADSTLNRSYDIKRRPSLCTAKDRSGPFESRPQFSGTTGHDHGENRVSSTTKAEVISSNETLMKADHQERMSISNIDSTSATGNVSIDSDSDDEYDAADEVNESDDNAESSNNTPQDEGFFRQLMSTVGNVWTSFWK